MRENFWIKEAVRPISPAVLKSMETHCFNILSTAMRGEVVEKMNYLADGMECVFLHSDGKRYRIEIKPIKEDEDARH